MSCAPTRWSRTSRRSPQRRPPQADGQLRPRLAFLADLFADVGTSVRRRRERPGPVPPQAGARGLSRDEELSAQEVKRRLDETQERLKRETAPGDNAC